MNELFDGMIALADALGKLDVLAASRVRALGAGSALDITTTRKDVSHEADYARRVCHPP